MSFDTPSTFAEWQSSLASTPENTLPGRGAKQPQSAWASQTSNAGNRRGLPSIATSNINAGSGTSIRKAASGASPVSQTTAISPLNSTFPSFLAASRAIGSRQPSSGSPSSFPPLQSGASHQSHTTQTVSSPRSRTITPSPQLAGTTSHTLSQGGQVGGGGGGTGVLRGSAYSPSPTAQNFASSATIGTDRYSNAPLSAGVANAGQSSFTKITVAQVLLLLDTINEKDTKAKWDVKAEQIRKVYSLRPSRLTC